MMDDDDDGGGDDDGDADDDERHHQLNVSQCPPLPALHPPKGAFNVNPQWCNGGA